MGCLAQPTWNSLSRRTPSSGPTSLLALQTNGIAERYTDSEGRTFVVLQRRGVDRIQGYGHLLLAWHAVRSSRFQYICAQAGIRAFSFLFFSLIHTWKCPNPALRGIYSYVQRKNRACLRGHVGKRLRFDVHLKCLCDKAPLARF